MDDTLVTSLPCVECGSAVFQRTARVKRFCSRECGKRHWKRTHPYVEKAGEGVFERVYGIRYER